MMDNSERRMKERTSKMAQLQMGFVGETRQKRQNNKKIIVFFFN